MIFFKGFILISILPISAFIILQIINAFKTDPLDDTYDGN